MCVCVCLHLFRTGGCLATRACEGRGGEVCGLGFTFCAEQGGCVWGRCPSSAQPLTSCPPGTVSTLHPIISSLWHVPDRRHRFMPPFASYIQIVLYKHSEKYCYTFCMIQNDTTSDKKKHFHIGIPAFSVKLTGFLVTMLLFCVFVLSRILNLRVQS